MTATMRLLIHTGKVLMTTLAWAMLVPPVPLYADTTSGSMGIAGSADAGGTLTLVTIVVVLMVLTAWMAYVIATTKDPDDEGAPDSDTGETDQVTHGEGEDEGNDRKRENGNDKEK